MKKISLVLAALAFVAVSLVGCASNEVVSAVTDTIADATTNIWYQYTKGSLNVDLGTSDNSAADASTSKAQFAKVYFRYNTASGLTVVLEQNATSGSSTKPLCATKTYTTEEFGSGKWTALVASGKIAKSSAPASTTNKSSYTDISEISDAVADGLKGGVQWKKLLAQTLLSWLE